MMHTDDDDLFYSTIPWGRHWRKRRWLQNNLWWMVLVAWFSFIVSLYIVVLHHLEKLHI